MSRQRFPRSPLALLLLLAIFIYGATADTEAHVAVKDDALLARVREARAWLRSRLPAGQWEAAKRLNDAESHWHPRSGDPSWCYGIVQACPAKKMRIAIRAERGKDWDTIHDPKVQLLWQHRFYIPARYGTYKKAFAFQEEHGWY